MKMCFLYVCELCWQFSEMFICYHYEPKSSHVNVFPQQFANAHTFLSTQAEVNRASVVSLLLLREAVSFRAKGGSYPQNYHRLPEDLEQCRAQSLPMSHD